MNFDDKTKYFLRTFACLFVLAATYVLAMQRLNLHHQYVISSFIVLGGFIASLTVLSLTQLYRKWWLNLPTSSAYLAFLGFLTYKCPNHGAKEIMTMLCFVALGIFAGNLVKLSRMPQSPAQQSPFL
ncbi:hypothetical protein [Zooshikella harenae]|uniref:Uncharacterized protein n=1 Tax=Zooshikella harenae TaxID=2827238 RepID=A0ABS5Z8P1_9GAMM|nr:hypothetical protein [Zooshikella harenae]MBU2710407.1 hypothetical protein [Zooshikella harenae]